MVSHKLSTMDDFVSDRRQLSKVEDWPGCESSLSIKQETFLEPEVILMETHDTRIQGGRRWSSMRVRVPRCSESNSLHIGKITRKSDEESHNRVIEEKITAVIEHHFSSGDNSTSNETEDNCCNESHRIGQDRDDNINNVEIIVEKTTVTQETASSSKNLSKLQTSDSQSFLKDNAPDFIDYYECPFCTSCFSFKTDFQKHVRIHTRLKTFQCSVCAKRFAEKSELENHRLDHDGEKPNTCSVCGKAFKHKSALSRHAKLHTGGGHECLVCHRVFTTRQTFDVHTRKHTGERPYKCSTCHKGFSSLGNLSNHVVIHKDEKPYKCTVCNKKFTQQGNLKIHTRLHTGEKPFQCPICERPFSLKGNLKSHMKVHMATQ